jgi:hypothetical protein
LDGVAAESADAVDHDGASGSEFRLSADCWSAIECLSRGDSNLSKDRSIVGMCSDGGAHQQ